MLIQRGSITLKCDLESIAYDVVNLEEKQRLLKYSTSLKCPTVIVSLHMRISIGM